MTVTISRCVELDAGHRVPDHASKCRNPHGHRYRVVLEVVGPVIDERGCAEDGMVTDFGCLGDILAKVVHDPCDHGFFVAAYDGEMLGALGALTTAKVLVVDFPPTAERLAAWWGEAIVDHLPAGLDVVSVTVWETPKCSAEWRPAPHPFDRR